MKDELDVRKTRNIRIPEKMTTNSQSYDSGFAKILLENRVRKSPESNV